MEPNTQTQETETQKTKLIQEIEVPLTDGRKAVLKRGKGLLAVKAQKIAKTQEEVPLALASLMTTIDGKQLIYEDLLDMDLADTLAIQGAALRLAGNDTQTAS